MKLKKGFVVREVCAQKVIVAEGLEAVDFGKLLSLNDSSAFVWQLAEKQGDFTVESLASAFCKEYETDEKTAQNDVKELLEKWQKLGVIE